MREVSGFSMWTSLYPVTSKGGTTSNSALNFSGCFLFKVEFDEAGLGDRTEALLLDGLRKIFGEERFDDIALEIFGEAAAENGLGHLAGTEAGDAGLLAIALEDGVEGGVHFGGGDFGFDFAAALGVERTKGGLVGVRLVIVAGVVVIVIVSWS